MFLGSSGRDFQHVSIDSCEEAKLIMFIVVHS